jgi:site-specific recombinase
VITQSIRRLSRRVIDLVRPTYEREQLHYLLSNADPKAELSDRLIWLEQLMFWVRTSSIHRHDFDPETGQLHNARLRFIISLLDRNLEWKTKVSATLRSLIKETSARSLFSQIGLNHQRSLFSEASDRLMKRVLPKPAQETELSELFLRIFEDESDSIWVRHIPSSLMGQLVDLVRYQAPKPEEIFVRWREDLEDALLILGARVAALGTLPEILQRLRPTQVHSLPLLNLSHILNEVVNTHRKRQSNLAFIQQSLDLIEACREDIKVAYKALEHSGVSVGLVYTLENLSSALRRIELLLKLLLPPSDSSPELTIQFLATLVDERLSQSTLRDLVTTNLHLISSKIVERAGASGEHYIARTRKEYFQMIRAGLGGGAVMVFTTLVKFSLNAMGAPLFFEGLFFSLNYAGGFVTLQLLGFTLATKQPSATASALAGKLRELEEQGEVREFVNEVCRMTRTQFAALLGNLMLLIPLSISLDLLVLVLSGHHILPAETARYVLHSLNPIKSFTIPMAALTGVWLWLSSIVAGWFENWVVFRQLPQAIASQRRLIQVLGKARAERIGEWVLNNATLFGGNISLGFFMGFTSVVGRFVGLPLDVRHVTLAACSLTLASGSLLSQGVNWKELILPIIGVLSVGFLNFAVGYSLSFAVAARARNVHTGALFRLFRAVRVRLRNRPTEFFFPPRQSEKST